ncbi:MAG TPA: SPFH domain-containing protein [Kofleriaceae bacterium]|nr:SPFH domain-containing protein [Kofleriaceae bacterium]
METFFAQYSHTVGIIVAGIVGLLLLRKSNMLRYIPNNRIGIVEKLWSRHGSLKHGFIALAGEAGFQSDVLRGGWHMMFPFQYRVHVMPLVTIPQGKLGYVFARDGQPLPPTQALASNAVAKDFTDVADFLRTGQRGPQRRVLREGTYAINLAQFVVLTEDELHYLSLGSDDEPLFRKMAALLVERHGFAPVVITSDLVGIVTVHDGPSLAHGEIIAPTVGAEDPALHHNSFQDPEQFLAAGGQRGRQLEVLVEGTYFINRLFATVETIGKTVVEVGHVGVVVSYTGTTGSDLSGESYRHGEMVANGQRGVWSEPLLPGKYAFNAYAGRVLMVPTTNFILKWIDAEVGSHQLDENLSEISLITKDAFEPSLPLSVVVHIDYKKAPLVVQQFGDVKKLVEQTLDPMVSAYFKNIGQTRTLIQLIHDRSAIQDIAGEAMKAKFDQYHLELKEVLIGTPASKSGDKAIDQILTQLRARQIAEEQVETYARQEKAAGKERELREAEAKARAQQALTESDISIAIQSNVGKAEYQRSVQQAAQIRTIAEAEADKTRVLAAGEAQRVKTLAAAHAEEAARVGIAQALAIDEQVRASGGPQLLLTRHVMERFSEAIERAKIDVVPRVMIQGGQGKDGAPGTAAQGSVFEALLAMMLSDKVAAKAADMPPRDPELDHVRDSLRDNLVATLTSNGDPTVVNVASVTKPLTRS